MPRKTKNGTAKRKGVKAFGWEFIKTVCLAVILALIVRDSLVMAYVIPSGSMEGTLAIGDRIMVSKCAYGVRLPWIHLEIASGGKIERGDVIVFKHPEQKTDYVKRVIGLPGEEVRIVDKQVYINGQPIQEPYVRHNDPVTFSGVVTARDNFGPVIVPKGKLFVLGDNRDNSNDSRFWGFVDQSLVEGQAGLRLWSYDSKHSKIRWSRILTWID
jgi:signal peptidase I